MKFEFTPQEEGERPPSPAALIAAAAERMQTQARTDFHRLHSSLNHMLYTVEAARPQPGLTFADTGPELGVDVFRPEAFGSGSVEEARG